MIDKLDMFIALSREAHFGRAAERLNISQPTLSAGIKQLEEQLGVQLVYRGSRFGGLTPEGQTALVWAQRIVGNTRQLREEMRSGRHGLAGEMRLAVIPTALTWAAELATSFSALHPKVHFTILSRSSREILHQLESFDADAGITYLDNEPLGRVDTLRLGEERYVLVCADTSDLARRACVGWGELAGRPLALLTPDMQNRRILNQIFADHGVTPATTIETNSIIALVASVASGGCVTVLPGTITRFLAGGEGVVTVPMEVTGAEHGIGLVLPHRGARTPMLDAFLAEAGKLFAPV
nr:LysR family transcriptional regulator [Celeribacter indicus]